MVPTDHRLDEGGRPLRVPCPDSASRGVYWIVGVLLVVIATGLWGAWT
jgi:hypothetical protein